MGITSARALGSEEMSFGKTTVLGSVFDGFSIGSCSDGDVGGDEIKPHTGDMRDCFGEYSLVLLVMEKEDRLSKFEMRGVVGVIVGDRYPEIITLLRGKRS